MGSQESSNQIKEIPYEKKMRKLNKSFREEKFAKIRNSSSVHKDLKAFCKIGKYLNNKNPYSLPRDNLNKVCFLIINTYNRKTYKLGSGPINDGYMIAKLHKNRGYQIFFLHNPSRDQFKQFTAFFLSNTKECLTIFYEGRSTTLVGTEGDVIKGQNDAIVLDLNYVKDIEMAKILELNSNDKCKVVLISNCCNGPAIWRLDGPSYQKFKISPNVISISAIKQLPEDKDNDSSSDSKSDDKKKNNDKKNNSEGIFIYYLLKCENQNPKITPNEIADQINPQLNNHKLSLYYYSKTSDLDSQPLIL